MNLAIRQTSRKLPKQSLKTTKSASSMNSMLEKFGLDPSSLDDEAESIWTMLNNLHETDPISYQKFIEQQMDEMKQFEVESRNQSKTFTPKKGFVVKAFFVGDVPMTEKIEYDREKCTKQKQKHKGQPMTKLFVNFCHHDAVQVPICNGVKVTEADLTKSIPDAQIPMVISDIRDFKDSTNQDAHTVDVVFNTWCIRKSQDDTMFKSQMIALSLKSIVEEKKVMIQLQQWKIIKSTYKGGLVAPDNKTMNVHPFPIDAKMIRPKNGNNEENSLDSEAAKKDEASSIMNDPQSLLNSFRSNNNDNTEESFILLNKDKKSSTTKGMLIQEIEDVPNVQAKKRIQEVDISAEVMFNDSKQTKPKAVPLSKTMKGFLNKSKKEKHKPIYETPSSGDGMGGTGGSYAKLLSKCQVIDTTNLPSKDQKSSEYSTNNRKAFDKGIKKGFLEKGQRLFQEEDGYVRGDFDAEFDAIMKRADPNFARTFSYTSEKEMRIEEFDDAIKTIRNGMSSSQQPHYVSSRNYNDPIQPDMPKSRNSPKESMKKDDNNIQIKVLRESKESISFQFDFSGCGVTNISDIDVTIFEHQIRIKTSCGSKIKHHHPLVNENVDAKFKKKTKMLTLTF